MSVLLAFSVGGSIFDVAGYAGSNRKEKLDAGLVKRPRESDALCSPIQRTVTLSEQEPQQTVIELCFTVGGVVGHVTLVLTKTQKRYSGVGGSHEQRNMQKRAKWARLVSAIIAVTVLLAFSVGGSIVDVAGYAGSNRKEKSDAGLVKRPRESDAELVSSE